MLCDKLILQLCDAELWETSKLPNMAGRKEKSESVRDGRIWGEAMEYEVKPGDRRKKKGERR
jgi:hypothetical protein